MANTNSNIEWTDTTWNPITGCTKISPGCKNCYAEATAKRLHKMGQDRYRNGFNLTIHEDLIDLPSKWRKPRKIFVNSMSDLFHEKVPDEIIQQIFHTMLLNHRHCFQILTKRPERALNMAHKVVWSNNIWMGTSIENEEYIHRADILREIPANIRFLSLEPLLGPLPSLDLTGIHWVIVGGESGPNARPTEADWMRQIRDNALAHNVPFFFKQWGGKNQKAKHHKILDGMTWEQFPTTRMTLA